MRTLPLLALAILGACAATPDVAGDERARNEAALHESAAEIARGDAGRYVVVQHGRLDGQGPAIEAALAAAARTADDPTHRFVFRPADAGPRFHMMRFLPAGGRGAGPALFEALGVRVERAANGTVTLTGPAQTVRFAERNSPSFEMVVSAPAGGARETLHVAYAGHFDGMLLLDRESAADLGLALFEVPGKSEVEVALGRPFEARRSAVLVRIPRLGVSGRVEVVYEAIRRRARP